MIEASTFEITCFAVIAVDTTMEISEKSKMRLATTQNQFGDMNCNLEKHLLKHAPAYELMTGYGRCSKIEVAS
jgi:hypothetical protein